MKKILLVLYMALPLLPSNKANADSPVDTQTKEFILRADKPGVIIQPTMYGLFFEDINYAADGGLYGELVKNRSFDFPQPFMGWNILGNVTMQDDGPFNRNPKYVRLGYSGHPKRLTCIENLGFFGIGLRKDAEYRFSVWARQNNPGVADTLRVELITGGNTSFLQQKMVIDSKDWKKYEMTMKSNRTDGKCRLRIYLASDGGVDLEHVSLFPADTWKGHANGLRKDLAQALAELHPGILRFPGGCIVEGHTLDTRYQWKKTVGPIENRPLNENRWQHTRGRLSPDYFQSGGLGFFEFFQFSEEIGAEPLPILSCGMACQFANVGSDKENAPLDQLDPYIQDALDLIEFANGNISTPWGKVRAEMGHPAPFNMKFIGVGNEQWGQEYTERSQLFVKAIREKHPEIKIIGSSGPDPDGEKFDFLWPEMKKQKVDLVDEHYYRPFDWFTTHATRYDSYDRKGPKVFAGEYACNKTRQYDAALAEAAFMTGLERNADVVHMASYAPLLAHKEGWQWTPDLIWFDNTSFYPTCSYYVQQMYAVHKGTNVLPLTMNGKPLTGAEDQGGLFASAAWEGSDNSLIVKIVNISSEEQDININIKGLQKGKALTKCKITKLVPRNGVDGNSLEKPDAITPTYQEMTATGSMLNIKVAPRSFSVCRMPIGSNR